MTFWDRIADKLGIPRIYQDIAMLKEENMGLLNQTEAIHKRCDKIMERIHDIENELGMRIDGCNEDISHIEEKIANLKLQVEGLSFLLSRKEVKEFLDTLTAE